MHFSQAALHIPDGFLSPLVSILLWVVILPVISLALRNVSKGLGERQIPIMGVLSATIFAGQMLNFSIAGGTSGHLLGAAIATILLGPWAAIIVLTSVVSLQAIIFQDGGLLSLGANIFNMAVIGVLVSHFSYVSARKFLGQSQKSLFIGGAVAAWLSIVASALACALELALSGTSPASIAIPAMGGIHMIIGVGEALITIGALAFLYASRKDLLDANKNSVPGNGTLWIFGLGIAIFLAILSPLASTRPDGLEWFAQQQGFLGSTQKPVYEILPNYLIPGISNSNLATILAGVLGVGLIGAVSFGIFLYRNNKNKKNGTDSPSGNE